VPRAGAASLRLGPATPWPAVLATYLLFGIFLGGFGVHRFYLGRPWTGGPFAVANVLLSLIR